jgi:hypothetical protein
MQERPFGHGARSMAFCFSYNGARHGSRLIKGMIHMFWIRVGNLCSTLLLALGFIWSGRQRCFSESSACSS